MDVEDDGASSDEIEEVVEVVMEEIPAAAAAEQKRKADMSAWIQDLSEDLCASALQVLRRAPMRQGGTAPGILCELAEKVNNIVVKTLNGGAMEEGVDMGEDGAGEETLDMTEVPAEGEEVGLSDEEEEEEKIEEEEEGDISDAEEGVEGRPQRLNVQQPHRYRDDVDEGGIMARPSSVRERVAVGPHDGRGCSKCRYSKRGCGACRG